MRGPAGGWSSPGRLSEQCAVVSEKWQKDLCGITKARKDKVISKQVAEDKTTRVKWGK